MDKSHAGPKAVLTRTKTHTKILILGLLAILVPIVLAERSLAHTHKTVKHLLTVLAPEIGFLQKASGAAGILLLILAFCWFVGWMMTRTEVGQRWLEWEKAKVFVRSTLWKDHQKRAKKTDAAPAPTSRPVLARIAGDWQPGIVVEEQSSGWATVFVPDIPALTTGQIYFVPPSRILAVETPLDAFRKTLMASGRGSQDWLNTLASASPAAG